MRDIARLRRFSAACLAISSADTVGDMLQVTADCTRGIFDAAEVTASAHLDPGRRFRAVSPAPEEAAAPANRAHDHAPHPGAGPIAAGPGIVAVPLTGRDGRHLGTIEVSSRAGAEFSREDEDLLLQLARMTAVAIENAFVREAHEADRLKDEFLATVSHELRTPLSAMTSWAWMLRRGRLDPAGTERAIDAIERNARAQARLVEDLLDVSRIVSGKLRLSPRVVDLAAAVSAAVESVSGAARAKGITLASAVDPHAGSVFGDADRLQQVVRNLLSNAVKFTPGGGRIDVQLARTGEELQVRVTDTGSGISPDFLPHVFERFRRADPTSTGGGLGLGLAIVRHIVELHGGRVEARSPGEGRGATFVVTLPHAGPRPDVPRGSDASRESPCGGTLDGLRVLIVEDEVDTRESLAVLLAHAGACVATVGTATEALDVLRTWGPELLLCDIGLPSEDGYSLIRRVRALGGQPGGAVPAVALTAYARESDRAHALAAGFQAHLAKPCEPERLLEVVARIVGKPSRGPGRPEIEPAGSRA